MRRWVRHSSYKSIKRMWGGAGLINLGQWSRPHMAETSALVTKTLVTTMGSVEIKTDQVGSGR